MVFVFRNLVPRLGKSFLIIRLIDGKKRRCCLDMCRDCDRVGKKLTGVYRIPIEWHYVIAIIVQLPYCLGLFNASPSDPNALAANYLHTNASIEGTKRHTAPYGPNKLILF